MTFLSDGISSSEIRCVAGLDAAAVFLEPTLSQQLVSLAHPVLDQALAVIQRFDAVCLDGVHLSQQRGQTIRQQPSRCCLKLGEVPPEGLAGLT